jgi:hypothetical protein
MKRKSKKQEGKMLQQEIKGGRGRVCRGEKGKKPEGQPEGQPEGKPEGDARERCRTRTKKRRGRVGWSSMSTALPENQ